MDVPNLQTRGLGKTPLIGSKKFCAPAFVPMPGFDPKHFGVGDRRERGEDGREKEMGRREGRRGEGGKEEGKKGERKRWREGGWEWKEGGKREGGRREGRRERRQEEWRQGGGRDEGKCWQEFSSKSTRARFSEASGKSQDPKQRPGSSDHPLRRPCVCEQTSLLRIHYL